MASSLTTVPGSGTQTSTQSPQASVGSGDVAPKNSGSLQPGTATSLLNTDQGGVALNNQSLSVVNLGARTASVSKFAQPEPKQTSPVLYGVSGLLFVVAVVLFALTMRSAKNTTEEL